MKLYVHKPSNPQILEFGLSLGKIGFISANRFFQEVFLTKADIEL